MDELQFRAADFEGPLDLMLHLISKHKLDLYNINIFELIDQYVAAVGTIGPEELESASDFVEMAAHLVRMKSALLLPRQDEAEEMKQELTGRLIEYSLCKQAAARLRDMSQGLLFYVRGMLELESDDFEYRVKHDPVSLVSAYMGMQGRAVRREEPTQRQFGEYIAAPVVSVNSRIVNILRRCAKKEVSTLAQLFAGVTGRSEAVATFLALLELMRAGRIAVADDTTLSLIRNESRTK